MMINEDMLLARGAVYKKIKKNDFIFKEGTACNYYYQLVEGKVNWLNYDTDGKLFIHMIIHPGECFGELPLFDAEPYAATALADSDAVILQLPKVTFHELLKENQALVQAFAMLFAQRIRYQFFIIKEIAQHNPEHKIISILNFFKQRYPIDDNNGWYKINFTRQQIAGMTGLRIETVIRVIRKLNESGKLIINKGKVFLPTNNTDINHATIVF